MATRAVTVAGAALTAAGALAFARVFDSGDFVVPTLGAAIGPFVVGAIAHRVRAGMITAVAASLATGIVYVLVAIDGWAPWAGWPDLGELRTSLAEGWHAARNETAPVTATTGMLLLLVGATWMCGMLVDQLLARDVTIGALVPPLALFVVATVLGADVGGLTVTLGFLIAAVAFLLLQHQAIVGRRRGRFFGRRVAGGTGLLAAGSVIGVVAVLAGITVAPALPGADADPLLDYRGLSSERGGEVYEPAIAPILDVGARLQRGAPAEVFRVRAEQPAYWRMLALDEWDGHWMLEAPEGSIDSGLDRPADEPLVQEFRIGNLGERWMPAAFEARRAHGDTDALVIRDSATLVTPEGSVNGLVYSVESELPPLLGDVTPAMVARTAAPVPPDVARFTELPDDFSPAIAGLAEEVTADATTPFDQARALRDFFRGPSFEYDQNARYNTRGLEDGEHVVEAFLEARNGFCVQFASAYALMARSLDIPTRIAVGFTPGTLSDGEYVVTDHEAHAWPEVWLAGIGWTGMFDPTPPSAAPGGSNVPGEEAPAGQPAGELPPDPGIPEPAPNTLPPPEQTPPESPSVQVPVPDGAANRWWLPVLSVPAALVAAAGSYIAAVLLLKRHRRARRRRGAPAVAVVGAWQEAIDRLGEAREPVSPTSTPHELAGALARANPAAGAALDDLAACFGAARYGRAPLDRENAARAWEQVVVFEQALETDVPLRTRWRRRLRARGPR